MIYAVAVLLYLWAFWLIYVLVMGLYRAHLADRLKGLSLVLAMPVVVLGYLMDILAQYTIAVVFFLDLPARHEYLVTDRLKRYMTHGKGWRAKKAEWICTHLLDVFDPTGKHC